MKVAIEHDYAGQYRAYRLKEGGEAAYVIELTAQELVDWEIAAMRYETWQRRFAEEEDKILEARRERRNAISSRL